jgi:hypothetical protein
VLPSSRARIVLLIYLFEECVQNFGKEICWKNVVWKNGKKCKNNIMIDMREMGFEDSRWMEPTDEIQWRTFV